MTTAFLLVPQIPIVKRKLMFVAHNGIEIRKMFLLICQSWGCDKMKNSRATFSPIEESLSKRSVLFGISSLDSLGTFLPSFFRMGGCPLDCSGRGVCDPATERCSCPKDWRGDGCQVPVCPGNDCQPDGTCEEHGGRRRCRCNLGYRGQYHQQQQRELLSKVHCHRKILLWCHWKTRVCIVKISTPLLRRFIELYVLV